MPFHSSVASPVKSLIEDTGDARKAYAMERTLDCVVADFYGCSTSFKVFACEEFHLLHPCLHDRILSLTSDERAAWMEFCTDVGDPFWRIIDTLSFFQTLMNMMRWFSYVKKRRASDRLRFILEELDVCFLPDPLVIRVGEVYVEDRESVSGLAAYEAALERAIALRRRKSGQ
jgi:hypothetical protein